MKLIKRILLGLLILLVVAQFIRPDYSNPPVDSSQDFIQVHNPPSEIASMIKSACYDCHSHETVYPWYSQVAPVSWWTVHHVEEGREHLNFSVWTTYNAKKKAHKMEECHEEMEKGAMPLQGYDLMHADAKLSASQKEALVNYFKEMEARERSQTGRVR